MKNFKEIYVSGKGIPEYINNLGSDIVGLELGVWTGENFCFILQSCPNIKTLYGIDPFKPYMDWNRLIDENFMANVKATALDNINNQIGDLKEKVTFFEDYANNVLDKIPDGSLDFIFIDGDHSYEQAKNDITKWWPKVRTGGLFSGHDFSLPGVTRAIKEFRAENNISTRFKFCDNDVWLWYKE